MLARSVVEREYLRVGYLADLWRRKGCEVTFVPSGGTVPGGAVPYGGVPYGGVPGCGVPDGGLAAACLAVPGPDCRMTASP